MKKHYFKLLLISTCIAITVIAGTIDLNQLLNYSNQTIPNYIIKNNLPANNAITDAGATLGRVLFYDKKLSVNNTIACASCHIQQFAFGDTAVASIGFNGGRTGRHSMRLANARFSNEVKFFWDERATSLENQTTHPIKDAVEMGYSGLNGQQSFDSLTAKLTSISYYPTLFNAAFGSTEITELKIQRALAQFIRSIQSFDSKYDIGRAQVANDGQQFPNFTMQENMGKMLFLGPPPQGAGCAGCHRAPEFDIDPNSRNNGVIGVIGDTTIDLTNTRSPSLRDLVNSSGQLNGPLMHNGIFNSLEQVVNHYNLIPNNPANTNLDNRLRGPGGVTQNLQLSQQQKDALVAFLKTLSGNAVYTDTRWSNPFDSNGNVNIIPVTSTGFKQLTTSFSIQTYPNPVTNTLYIETNNSEITFKIYNVKGQLVYENSSNGKAKIEVSNWINGTYVLHVMNTSNQLLATRMIQKQ
jgi:cytochrome c peroxidase